MTSKEDFLSKGSSRKTVKDQIIDFMNKAGPISFSPAIIQQSLSQQGSTVDRNAIQKALQRGVSQGVFTKTQYGYYTLLKFKLEEIADLAKYSDFFRLEREIGIHDVHAYAKDIRGVYKRLRRRKSTSWIKKRDCLVTQDIFGTYGPFAITIYPNDTIQVTLKNHDSPITQIKDYIAFFSLIKVILKEYIPEKNFLERFMIKQWHLNQDDFTIRYLGPEISFPVFQGMRLAIYRKGNGTRFESRNSMKSNKFLPWMEIGQILTHNEGAMIITEAVDKLQISNLGIILSKQYAQLGRDMKSGISFVNQLFNNHNELLTNEMQSFVDITSDINQKLDGISEPILKKSHKRLKNRKLPEEKVIAMRRYASKIRNEPGDRFGKIASLFGISKSSAHKYCRSILSGRINQILT